MQRQKTKLLARAGVIAAMYAGLVFLGLPLASGAVQIRFAEALCVLPAFTAAGVPGVTLGCLLANLLTGAPLPDVIFGTLATLLGAVFTRKLRNNIRLALLPPILSNALILPFVLRFCYGLPGSLAYFFLTVGLGETVSAGILGGLLALSLNKRKTELFGE